jgi:hypothetical protein
MNITVEEAFDCICLKVESSGPGHRVFVLSDKQAWELYRALGQLLQDRHGADPDPQGREYYEEEPF